MPGPRLCSRSGPVKTVAKKAAGRKVPAKKAAAGRATPKPRLDEAALRRLTAAWPGVGAGIKWEADLVFMVDAKMFCALCVAGPEKGKLAFKVESGRFLELTDRPGVIPAPYLARAHWIAL